mmetsp:Transcript_26802/g.86052  ORF Transcript_26802/g.86052 Transcript_26802/m.86052 type:complete len:126 (-) Transcript_26802:87-464(-)
MKPRYAPRPAGEDDPPRDMFLNATYQFKRRPKSKALKTKKLKQILQAENFHLLPVDEPTYVNIEAPPSMYPKRKYCDLTGYVAPYTDPLTKMQYCSVAAFAQIRALTPEQVQAHLALRGANVVLR